MSILSLIKCTKCKKEFLATGREVKCENCTYKDIKDLEV